MKSCRYWGFRWKIIFLCCKIFCEIVVPVPSLRKVPSKTDFLGVFAIAIPVPSLDNRVWCRLKSVECAQHPLAKNLLQWAYALRWVPVQTLDNWGVLLENLTMLFSQVGSLCNNNLLETYKVWNMNRCFVLKNTFMDILEVELDAGSPCRVWGCNFTFHLDSLR